MDISVVIPVYGCKGALYELHDRLVKSLIKITDKFEIILVNDSCPQNSWETIKEICEIDRRVIGINLSRNFGQIKALTAGLDNASGDYIVVMDCDLQDKPEEIINFYNKIQEGYDVVFARRVQRQDNKLKKVLSRMFYMVYDYFADTKIDYTISNFSMCRKIVIDNYLKMREKNRAYTLFIKWMGFKQVAIDTEHSERAEGKSSYDFNKRIKMAIEIITSQSNKPLIASVKIGFLASLISFLYIVYIIIRYFAQGISVSGWTSTIVSIYFVGGIIISNLGIIGIYIGNIFNEAKDRPIYIIKEKLNKE